MHERAPLITFKEPSEYKPGDVLISAEDVEQRMGELASEVACDYQYGDNLLVVGLLNGAAYITADLQRRLTKKGLTDSELDFMKVSSYPNGTTAEHEPRIELDLKTNPAGRKILLVDDICDTGKSLDVVSKYLVARDAKDVKTVVLLDKPSRRVVVDFKPNYKGFTIPDIWAQGVGLDTRNKFRGDDFISVGDENYMPKPLPPR